MAVAAFAVEHFDLNIAAIRATGRDRVVYQADGHSGLPTPMTAGPHRYR